MAVPPARLVASRQHDVGPALVDLGRAALLLLGLQLVELRERPSPVIWLRVALLRLLTLARQAGCLARVVCLLLQLRSPGLCLLHLLGGGLELLLQRGELGARLSRELFRRRRRLLRWRDMLRCRHPLERRGRGRACCCCCCRKFGAHALLCYLERGGAEDFGNVSFCSERSIDLRLRWSTRHALHVGRLTRCHTHFKVDPRLRAFPVAVWAKVIGAGDAFDRVEHGQMILERLAAS